MSKNKNNSLKKTKLAKGPVLSLTALAAIMAMAPAASAKVAYQINGTAGKADNLAAAITAIEGTVNGLTPANSASVTITFSNGAGTSRPSPTTPMWYLGDPSSNPKGYDSLTLISQDPSGRTNLAGNKETPIMALSNVKTALNLEGLNFISGKLSLTNASGTGAGLLVGASQSGSRVEAPGTLTLTKVTFETNQIVSNDLADLNTIITSGAGLSVTGTGLAANGTPDTASKTAVTLSGVSFIENAIKIGPGEGSANGSDSSAEGGGAWLHYANSLKYDGGEVNKNQVIVTNGGLARGGGLAVDGGQETPKIEIIDVAFTNNKAELDGLGKKTGGGLLDAAQALGGAFYAAGYVEINAPGNITSLPGYIFSGTTKFENNQASANYAADDGTKMSAQGGAVYLMQNSKASFGQTVFSNNLAESTGSAKGGAVAIGYEPGLGLLSSNLTFTEAAFDRNQAKGGGVTQGGALYLPFGYHSLIDSELTGNTATSNGDSGAAEGGAVYFKSVTDDNTGIAPKTLTITGTTFDGNQAVANGAGGQARGGAIYAETDLTTGGGSLALEDGTTFSNNQALRAGNDGAAQGGALYLGDDTTHTLTGAIKFTGNSAVEGGAIFQKNATLTADADADLLFSGNRAAYGAAIYSAAVGYTGSAAASTTLYNATFKDNKPADAYTGASNGGAIHNLADGNTGASGSIKAGLNLTNADFTDNTANTNGGAIYNQAKSEGSGTGEATVSVSGGSFSGNQAKNGAGGAIYNDGKANNNTATLNLTNTSFTNNKAGTKGGAIYSAGGTVNIKGTDNKTSTYSGNTAGGADNSIYLDARAKSSTLNINLDPGSTLDLRDAFAGLAHGSSQSVTVTKNGAGLWKLGGQNKLETDHSGSAKVDISGGTLALANGSTLKITTADNLGTQSFSLGSGAQLTSNGGNVISITNAGNGSSQGEISLAGNTTLNFNVAAFSSADQTGLTLQAASINAFDAIDVAKLNSTINLTSFGIDKTFKLLTLEGDQLFDDGRVSYIRSEMTYNGVFVDSLTSRLKVTVDKSVDNKTLLVTTEADESLYLTWTGGVNQNWELGTENWDRDDGKGASTFLDGDLVHFGGLSQGAVSILPSQVSVAGMIIDGGEYTFSGGRLASTDGTTLSPKAGDPWEKLVVTGASTKATFQNEVNFENGLAVGDGAQVVLETNVGTVEAGSFGEGMDIANAGTLTFSRTGAVGGSYEQKGQISGTGRVVKDGAGRVILSGRNDYTGQTRIDGGTLALAGVQAAGKNTADQVVDNGGTLELAFSVPGDNAFNQKITGNGGLTKTGSAKATLTNSASDYQGLTEIKEGTLALTGVNATGLNESATSVLIDDEAALELAFSAAGVNNYKKTITGDGGLTKTGSGTATLSADNTFAGATKVQSGRLVISGTLNGTSGVSVDRDAGLYIGGRVNTGGGVNMATGSVLAVGTGGQIDGNLSLASGVTLEAHSQGALKVSGSTTGLANTNFRLGNDNWTTGYYRLLEVADSSSLSGFKKQSGTLGIYGTTRVAQYSLDTSAADRQLILNIGSDRELVGYGSTSNQKKVAGAITSQVRQNGSSALFDAVAGAGSAGAIGEALTQLAGDSLATTKGTLTALNQNSIRTLTTQLAGTAPLTQANVAGISPVDSYLQSSFGDCEDGCVSENQPAPSGGEQSGLNELWVRVGGSTTTMDGTSNSGEAKIKGPELAVGYTATLPEDRLAGAYFRYSALDVDVNSRRYSADVDAVSLTLFGGQEWAVPENAIARFLGGVSFGRAWVDSKRTVAFNGFRERNKADYSADSLQVFGEIAYNRNFNDYLNLEPYFGLNYTRLSTESFKEKGGVSAVRSSQKVDDNVYSTLGGRLTAKPTEVLTANVNLAWQHTFGDTDYSSTLVFQEGGKFTSRGGSVSDNTLLTDIGVGFDLRPDTSLSFSYEGAFGNAHTSHAGTGTLSFHW